MGFIEYQDIINSYKSGNLDISSLKIKLDISKSLKARPKLRIPVLTDNYMTFYSGALEILLMQESSEKLENFEKILDLNLRTYYERIITSIKQAKAWNIMGILAREHSIEKFEKMNVMKKIQETKNINEKYHDFLKYQTVADLKQHLLGSAEAKDADIKKMECLEEMFNNLKNEDMQREFFCLDSKFLKALVEFKKSKVLRIEEFMQKKSQTLKNDYKHYSLFFTTEDYRDVTDCLIETSKGLKMSLNSTIETFSVMGESKAEQIYLQMENKTLDDLQKKYEKMLLLKKSQVRAEKTKKGENNIDKQVKVEKTKNSLNNMDTQNKITERKVISKLQMKHLIEERNRISPKEREILQNLKEKIAPQERVIPLIFSWLEREDITLTRRVGSKNLTAFFDKIKKIEAQTGIRVSLFLITNAGKEVTLKRLQEFEKKARNQGLPRLIEGALGGYSTFRVNKVGQITDVANMTQEERREITKLLDERPIINDLSSELINQEETNYIRYQFSDRKDKSITMNSLRYIAERIQKDCRLNKKIKILPFIEGRFSGLDVLMKEQLDALATVPNYYKTKYHISTGKTIYVKVDQLEKFIETKQGEDKAEK